MFITAGGLLGHVEIVCRGFLFCSQRRRKKEEEKENEEDKD